jgi:hypothetical protein
MREQLEQTTEVLADAAGRTVVLRFVTTVAGTTASGRRIRVEADGCDHALVGVVEARSRPGCRRAELTLHTAPGWSATELPRRLMDRMVTLAAAEGVRRLYTWASGGPSFVDFGAALPPRRRCRPDGGGVAVELELAS